MNIWQHSSFFWLSCEHNYCFTSLAIGVVCYARYVNQLNRYWQVASQDICTNFIILWLLLNILAKPWYWQVATFSLILWVGNGKLLFYFVFFWLFVSLLSSHMFVSHLDFLFCDLNRFQFPTYFKIWLLTLFLLIFRNSCIYSRY